MPADQMENPIAVFCDCRAALDPVATIHITNIVDHPVGEMVDVTANDTVGIAALGLSRHSLLEFADVICRALNVLL